MIYFTLAITLSHILNVNWNYILKIVNVDPIARLLWKYFFKYSNI